MNEIEIFLAVASAHLIAVSSPGPDFAVVFRYSIRYGTKVAVAVGIGIGSGILVHVFYSIMGLGLIIATNALVFNIFKLAGAAYLFYIAWLGWKSGSSNSSKLLNINDKGANKDANKDTPSLWQAYKVGFLTNALNVKATIFFLSVYLLLVNESPLLWQISYGVYMAVATAAYFACLSYIVGGKMRTLLQKHISMLEKGSAIMLAIMAFLLLLFAPQPQF